MSKTTEHGTYSYGYDGASRLTSVSNPTLEDENYSYDAVGNRVTASDANGDMTEVQLDGQVMFRYYYNADNRLLKVEGGNNNTIAEYDYDPFGCRLWKDVGGIRTYFFYSDEGLVAEYDASGTELKHYGYHPDSTWSTDPLFLKQNDQYYFYQNDHLGTPQKLVAQNGAVMWSAKYTAFGEATAEVETIANNLRFPGQYVDAETGWHYNWHRYYEPEIGRYLRVDPAKDFLNLYLYVLDDPVNKLDPTGLLAVCDALYFCRMRCE